MKILPVIVTCLALFASVTVRGSDIGSTDWSENAASNNKASPNGWTSGSMTPIQVEPTAREGMAALKRWYDHIQPTATSGGSANTQTLTYTVAPAAYVTGDVYTFKAGYTNSGATTLNINSLGAKAIQYRGVALSGGEIAAGMVQTVYYDGTQFQLLGFIDAVHTRLLCPVADGSTDNTSCLTAAAAAAKAAGRPLHIDAGSYKSTAALSLTAFTSSILGDGAGITKITFTDSNGITINNSGLSTLTTVNIDHVSLLSNASGSPAGTYTAIYLTGQTTAAGEGQKNFVIGPDTNISGVDQDNSWKIGIDLEAAPYTDIIGTSIIGSIDTYGAMTDAIKVSNSTDSRIINARLYHGIHGVGIYTGSESIYVAFNLMNDVDYGCYINTHGDNGGNHHDCSHNYINANRGIVYSAGTDGPIHWVFATGNLTNRQAFATGCACAIDPLDVGTAQSGSSTTITLASTASASNSYYNGRPVTITSGTGNGQTSGVITAYNGTTKVATITGTWATPPDNTSHYRVETLFVGFRVEGNAYQIANNSNLAGPFLATDISVDVISTAQGPIISGNALGGIGAMGSSGINNPSKVEGTYTMVGGVVATGVSNYFGDPATSYVNIGNLADSNNVYFDAKGVGADVGAVIRSKGAGQVKLVTGGGMIQLGGNSSVYPAISVNGSDAIAYFKTANDSGAAGISTNQALLSPLSPPATPATGGWVLWVDSSDGNKLKAKASTGTVVTIGTP